MTNSSQNTIKYLTNEPSRVQDISKLKLSEIAFSVKLNLTDKKLRNFFARHADNLENESTIGDIISGNEIDFCFKY